MKCSAAIPFKIYTASSAIGC
uniref:Uncharacterized protein n=1 Tax=Anguilla anguilla TaxID=7936 RepID=A0A0E9ULN9_ANGAN